MEKVGRMNPQGDIWVIGDLQGCCSPLNELLMQPELIQNPDDRFWFAGDIVNRGPNSLGSLRRIIEMGDRATVVLGNHDLHLLAVAAGVSGQSASDTLDDILNAPDARELIDWMRHQPMAHYAHGHLMVHAGVLAQWDVQKTLALAAEVESALRGPDWKDRLEHMYGNKPALWSDDLKGHKRLRIIVNALTRMRLCNSAGEMEFSQKGAPREGGDLMPWFDVPDRLTHDDTIVFGHWSTLGLLMRNDVICLDTGCVWGGKLTALRLRDKKVIQVACVQSQDPTAY